ncbi:hypothetical protein G6F68_017938 [Rhizopus microsporus]|nr:hypothetical protein G6F68_017938 [Rhizopus microsporus]
MLFHEFVDACFGGAAARQPQVEAADQDHDGDQVQQRPDDLQGQAGVIAEMQRAGHFQRGQVPGHLGHGRQRAGLAVHQHRGVQRRGQRRITAPPGDVMVRAAEGVAGEGEERHFIARQRFFRGVGGQLGRRQFGGTAASTTR